MFKTELVEKVSKYLPFKARLQQTTSRSLFQKFESLNVTDKYDQEWHKNFFQLVVFGKC